MATFGTTPLRDPLAEMPVATSDPESLIEDMKTQICKVFGLPPESITDADSYDWRKELARWACDELTRISQARRDDAALPQTRFGDYPSD